MIPEWVFALSGLFMFALPAFFYLAYGGSTESATDPVAEEVRARREREDGE